MTIPKILMVEITNYAKVLDSWHIRDWCHDHVVKGAEN